MPTSPAAEVSLLSSSDVQAVRTAGGRTGGKPVPEPVKSSDSAQACVSMDVDNTINDNPSRHDHDI